SVSLSFLIISRGLPVLPSFPTRRSSDLRTGRLARGDAANGRLSGGAGPQSQVMRIVITGASSGIGAALARYYASEDSVLGLIARRPGNQALKGSVTHYLVDVTDELALAAAAKDFIARFGAPELVIANAGVSTGTSGEDINDIAKLRRVLEVNTVGLAATLAAFAPAMRQAGRGTLA